MSRREVLLFAVLLIPSLLAAWANRDMPHFGWVHDDGIYFVAAKAWATGEGHRIVSLPGEPWQTKYPPAFSLLLAPIWIFWPEFPQNLHVATAVAWLFLPPVLLLFRVLLRRYGFPQWWAWLLVAILALNPYIGFFSRSLLSEMPFTLLLLATMLVAPRSALAAGCLAGVAYMTRTSALPLLVVFPGYFAFRRRWREAVVFGSAMLPFVIGWAVWSGPRKLRLDDPYIMYYVDYFWYQKYTVHFSNIGLILRKNIDTILASMAAPVLPLVSSLLEKAIAQAIAVASIVGVYRLARERDEARPYALFALAQVSILAVWHFPTDARLLLPLFPLLLAGLSKEVGRIAAVAWNLRRDKTQRPALIFFAVMMAPFLVVPLYNQYELFHLVPALAKDSRVTTADSLACAVRLQQDLPAGAQVLTDNDPLLYLATGRQGMRMISPVINWYEERFVEGELRAPDVARDHGMKYLLLNSHYRAGLKEDEVATRNKALQTRTDIQPLFTCGQATVFEVKPSPQTASRGTD